MFKNLQIGLLSIICLFYISCKDNKQDLLSVNECHFFAIIGESSCLSCEYTLYRLFTSTEFDAVNYYIVYNKKNHFVIDPLLQESQIKKLDIAEFITYKIIDEKSIPNINRPLLILTSGNKIIYKKEMGESVNFENISNHLKFCVGNSNRNFKKKNMAISE